MNRLLISIASIYYFGLYPHLHTFQFAWRAPAVSVATLLGGMALAVGASGEVGLTTVALGSLGALAFGLLASNVPLAVGALFLLAYAERSTRVRKSSSRGLHMAMAFVAGAVAALVAYSFRQDALLLRVVAVVVATVLAYLPLVISADDRIPFELDRLSRRLPSEIRTAAQDAAKFYRSASSLELTEEMQAGVGRSWKAYVKLVEARVALEDALSSNPSAEITKKTAALVEEKMKEHLRTIQRAYEASKGVEAAEAGLDDAAIRAVASAGEVLEEAQKAMLEAEGLIR